MLRSPILEPMKRRQRKDRKRRLIHSLSGLQYCPNLQGCGGWQDALRLRVEPKLTGLDPRLGGQLGLLPPFPSSVAAAPGVKDQVWMQRWLRSVRRGQPPEAEASREELEVLSGGRVAVFVRGYGVEGLRSRMVLPKLNYLLE